MDIEQEKTPLTDDEVAQAVREEISALSDRHRTTSAETYQEASQQVDALALDYYWGRRPGVTQEELDAGMCDYVSTDVRDGVHATLAEVMPAFRGNSPIEFPPAGQEDEDQAKTESEIVNYAIMGLGRGFTKIQAAIKDALLLRRGQIKVWVEEKARVEYETHEGVQAMVLPILLQQQRPNEKVEVVEGDEAAPGIANLKIRRTWLDKRFRIEAVPKDELLINRDHPSWDLDEARFVAHQRVVNRSDLIAMGVDPEILDEAPRYTHAVSVDTTARKRSSSSRDYNSGHESTDPFLLTECWYCLDVDQDGIAERRHIWLVGDEMGNGELVLNEPLSIQPFALGQAYLGFYDSEGLSLFDTLKIIQDLKTTLWRQMVNLAERILRGRHEIKDDGTVNIGDYEDAVNGGYVRVEELGSIQLLPEAQIPQSIFGLLEWVDNRRRESGGSAIDSATQALSAAADTWRGLERIMGTIEQVNAMVATTLSETLVASLYLKAHDTLRRNWDTEIQAKVAGAWLKQAPAQWAPRDQVSARVALSASERMQMQQVMSGIIQNLMALREKGSVISNDAKVHEAMVDQARYGGVSDPTQYYTDPMSQEGQEAQQQQAAQAQEAEAKQHEMAMAQLQVPKDMEAIKGEAALMKQQMINAQKENSELRKLSADLTQQSKDLAYKYDVLSAELAKYNAEHDKEPVPDTVAQLR